MDQAYSELLRARREALLARIARAAALAGRDPSEVRLLAVSKTVDADAVVAALSAGFRDFAESRPQELVRKLAALDELPGLPPARFDMIGNLQTNKVNAVLGRVALIHSVSSAHLARAVSDRAARRMEAGELAGPQDVLLEVNVSGEESKSGFDPEGLRREMDALAGLLGIRLRGLMTMAPRGDRDVARRTFEGLRLLRDELAEGWGLPLPELSCGMSEDFEEAVREGSTIVRLGRVVFDPGFKLE